MSTWTAKLRKGDYTQCALKTVKSPPEEIRRTVADFLRLVRITGICEHQLLIDDETILRELSADDLRELQVIDRLDCQQWAQLLAHRLCKERLQRGPDLSKGRNTRRQR